LGQTKAFPFIISQCSIAISLSPVMFPRNFIAFLLAACSSSASVDLLVGSQNKAASRTKKGNATFVPIWAIAGPWLAADDSSSSNAARTAIRRRRARDRDREADGYVSDDDRYSQYAKLRGAEEKPRDFEPVRARAPREEKERRVPVARTVVRDVDTYESDRFERDRFEDDREVRRMNNDIYFRPSPYPVHKLGLAVVNSFGFGALGVDRCIVGQVEVGILKAITFGGCGIWFFVDWIVITVNCLMFWKSIQAVGFSAEFERGTIQWAFWFTVAFLVFKMIYGAYEANRRGKSRSEPM